MNARTHDISVARLRYLRAMSNMRALYHTDRMLSREHRSGSTSRRRQRRISYTPGAVSLRIPCMVVIDCNLSSCTNWERARMMRSTYYPQRALGHPLSRCSLRLGHYQFAVSAFSARMSSACSATICFNHLFSSSSWRSFFTSLTSSPADLARHLEEMASEMPCVRQPLDHNTRWGILEDCNDLFLCVPFRCHGPLLWAPSQHCRTSSPMV